MIASNRKLRRTQGQGLLLEKKEAAELKIMIDPGHGGAEVIALPYCTVTMDQGQSQPRTVQV
jgi:hypothetical protein